MQQGNKSSEKKVSLLGRGKERGLHKMSDDILLELVIVHFSLNKSRKKKSKKEKEKN